MKPLKLISIFSLLVLFVSSARGAGFYEEFENIIKIAKENPVGNPNPQPLQPTSSMVVGDIDMNGTPYQTNDAILFTRYFFYGQSVFTISLSDQIDATDINGDGETLKLEDLVQLIRIAVGDLDPAETVDSTLGGNNFVQNNTVDSQVNLNCEHRADLIWLKFDGEIFPKLPNDLLGLSPSHFDGTFTRTIAWRPQGFGPGFVKIFDYKGSGEIAEAQGATYDGYEIDLTIDLTPTDITDNPDLLPDRFVLHQNYPNPFNNDTRIAFELPTASNVEFEIYNLLGQTVYSVTQRYSPGIHFIVWHGRNIEGDAAATGVYYYRLVTGEFVDSKKMILLK